MVSKYHGDPKGGLNLEGLNIQIKLKKLHLTQRWLIGQLRKRGFKTLYEPALSSILNEAYTGPMADAVIAASEEILKEQESI